MANPETDLQNLLRRIVETHPGEARVIEVDVETEKRAWRAWRKSAKRLAPELEQLWRDRANAFSRARSTIIG